MIKSYNRITAVIFVLAIISTLFSTFVFADPSLTSSISATPLIVQENETITVVMTVTNNGTETVNNVQPSTLTIGGTGTATLATGPPFTPVNIAAGGSATFTWTYTAGPIGTNNFRTVYFTGNASGTGAVSGSPVSSASNTSNEVIIGYCDYTECYTVPFGAKRNLNLNAPSKYCFPSADDGGIMIFLGPFYGTATLQPAGQQIRYISTNQTLCSEGEQDWIIFAALDKKGNPRGYFKICINVDCSGVTFPTADPDSASVCNNACVNVSVLDGDTYTAPLSSITIVDPPTGGTASVSGNKIYYCAYSVTPGDYNFNYSITDAIGFSNKAKVTVTVNPIPIADSDDVASVCSNACVNATVLDAGDTYTLPVTVNLVGNYSGLSPATVGVSGNKIYFCSSNLAPGSYPISYSITQSGCTSNTGTLTITINPSPVAVDDTGAVCETGSVDVNVTTNDTGKTGATVKLHGTPVGGTVGDPVNGVFTFTSTTTTGPASFEYNISNGTCSDIGLVTITVKPTPVAVDDTGAVCETGSVDVNVTTNDTGKTGATVKLHGTPVGGTVGDPVNGVFTFTSTTTTGPASFEYNISNGTCSDIGLVTITVKSCIVVAVDDTYTTNEDTCVNASVLGNDYDPDYPGQITFSVTDANVSPPSHGYTVDYDNYIQYCPDANWCGQDTFTYEITDVNGSTDTATVTINVTCIEDGLVARDDEYTTDEDTCVNAIVLTNDYDPDGRTFSITDSNVTFPSHGTATDFDTYIFYCPDANWCGVDTFVYEITDINGSTAQATVTITVNCVNDGLIAVDDFNSTTVNVCIDINVSKNDRDPDGDPFWIDSFTQPTTTFGTVTLVDSKGKLQFCPGMNCGTADFNYTITDGKETDSAKVTITVPCPPVVANDDFNSTERFTPIDFNITDNDDGSGYKVKIVPGSITTPSFGNVTVLDPNGTIRFDPEGICGTATFDYNATNGFSTDRATVTVDVPCPQATCPVAVDDYNKTEMNTCVILQIMDNDYDPNGDPIKVVYPSITDPKNGVIEFIDYENGIIKYCPVKDFCGTDIFEYTIVDIPRSTQDKPCEKTATVRIDVMCPKEKVPAALLYPLVDIERLTISKDPVVLDENIDSLLNTGVNVVLDGKVISVLEIVPGTQSLIAQVENRGFVTQAGVMVRFEGLPAGVTYKLEPASQKIKAHNIGTYAVTITAPADVPEGIYPVKAIAYTRSGTLDEVELRVVIS